ncbi:caspase recruitment domain-containing protein 19 isoform X2 [Rousettus aegyptiacus]|nr:caspase recruitment domain-containing protein 19 isoform X2 [Rousettus aegyptiacus]XP_015981490.2 caspase recruitment domain-containing protein 19 isoform X2 [Rousettus aegyptiacus]
MGHGRLSEQQVDRIILQLNRYYPQILSNKDAEKFRNPKASLRVRLCDLLGHLQRSNERDCQEFYRALYIHAQPLHSHLPSRHTLQNSDCTELDSGTGSQELSDRGAHWGCPCLADPSVGHKPIPLSLRTLPCLPRYRQPLMLISLPGPVAFLACLGLAAGLALLVYCCPPDPKVLPGARRVLGFSPVIVDRHVSRFLLAFLTDDLGGL